MKKENILLVDDSPEILEVLSRSLQGLNFFTFNASNVVDAIDILKQGEVDILITDIKMPGANGMDLARYTLEHYPQIPILLITGYPNISDAVQAIRTGVVDYLTKPFTQLELKEALDKVLVKLKTEKKPIHKPTSSELPVTNRFGIMGSSKFQRALYEIIERINHLNVTVLIQGESGTGKELVARSIHYSGPFHHTPFIAVNCGGIPENLLESELFGAVKGAYTGATENRPGFFQAAEGGTIFLDEIGNASLNVQTRLLRVLQEKEITPVGSPHAKKTNVRIIAATNANLKEMIAQGTFREDLYYRLNIVSVDIPPLRERKEDIPVLADHFVTKYTQEYRKTKLEIEPMVYEILQRYNWPGNIRELENLIQRCVVLTDNKLTPNDLPDYLKVQLPRQETQTLAFTSLKEKEKEYILQVLAACDMNKSKAAEILGIDRKTLRHKLEN